MDRLEELLTQRLCEVKRTQGDLHDWVHAVIDASAVSAETSEQVPASGGLARKKVHGRDLAAQPGCRSLLSRSTGHRLSPNVGF